MGYKGPSETYAARVERGRIATCITFDASDSEWLEKASKAQGITKSELIHRLVQAARVSDAIRDAVLGAAPDSIIEPRKPTMVFVLPVQTVSEANVMSAKHWRHRHRRAKEQRDFAELVTRSEIRPARWEKAFGGVRDVNVPLIITITRIAPRKLDSDNLASAPKHIRDGIAKALGIDDGDPRIEWRYLQEKSRKAKDYAVRVQIELAPQASPREPETT